MKFLFIADDITIFGGAERVITNLANVMSKMQDEKGKNEIEIFSLHRINEHLPYHLDLNVKVSFYTQPATKNDIKQIKNFYKRFAIKFKVILLKLKFFILHFRILKTDEILSRMLSTKISHCKSDIVLDNTAFSYHPFYKNNNTKYIMLMHTSYSDKATFFKYFNDLKDYDVLVILSHAEFSIWQAYHHNVRVIPNFIPEIPSKCTNHTQKFILSVGRMDKGDQKGFLRLLGIWKIVQDSLSCHTEGIARSISNDENKDISHSLNMTNDSKEIFRYAQNDKVEVAQNDKNQDCHSERSAKHEAKNLKEIHKDNENSLDSSATLSPHNDNLDLSQWKLIIVGDGVLKKEIESKIKELNLQDSIILKPFTKQIEKEYLNASIYAMSSHWEGFGMVLAEASSYSLPCVAFDVKTGPSDIIENEKSGFLVEDNDLQGYANKLMLLMRNENLRFNFGTKAKKLVSEKFSKEVVMKEWQGLFDELCK